MTLLVADAIDHIRHTLASESVPDIGAHRILNDAGHHLYSMHSWKWCEGAQATLTLTANQDYVWLPEDFREIVAVQPTNGLNAGFRLTTQERLLQLRSLAVSNSFEYNGAVVFAPRTAAATATVQLASVADGDTLIIDDAYNSAVTFAAKSSLSGVVDTATNRKYLQTGTDAEDAQALAAAINNAPHLFLRAEVSGAIITLTHQVEGTRGNDMTLTPSAGTLTCTLLDTGVSAGPVRARLDLWPTPSQYEPERLLVYYRSGWTPVETDSHVIPIPDWMESLYIQLVRAFARGYERESEGDPSARIASVETGPIAMAAKSRDKQMMPHMGPMRGGAATGVRSTYDHLWNFTSVSDPTT